MSEWQDKPDGDGVFHMQHSDGCRSKIHVYENQWRYVELNGKPCGGCALFRLDQIAQERSKVKRVVFDDPAPYVPPQPPKVEQYTAKYKPTGEFRFLTRVGNCYVSTPEDGYRQITWTNWDAREVNYTDITPCDQASTK